MFLNWIRSFWFYFLIFGIKCVGRFTTNRQSEPEVNVIQILLQLLSSLLSPKLTDAASDFFRHWILLWIDLCRIIWMGVDGAASLKKSCHWRHDRTSEPECSQWYFCIIRYQMESIDRLRFLSNYRTLSIVIKFNDFASQEKYYVQQLNERLTKLELLLCDDNVEAKKNHKWTVLMKWKWIKKLTRNGFS